MRTAKTLISMGRCPGWSESSLGAQPHCWFWHVTAHMTNGKTIVFDLCGNYSSCFWCPNFRIFTVILTLLERPSLVSGRVLLFQSSVLHPPLSGTLVKGFFTGNICQWVLLKINMSLVMRKRVFGSFRSGQTQNWPAQLQKLGWGLKFWLQKLEILHYLGSKNKGADQTAPMRRLICAFVVRIWHKTHFLMAWLKYILQDKSSARSTFMPWSSKNFTTNKQILYRNVICNHCPLLR